MNHHNSSEKSTSSDRFPKFSQKFETNCLTIKKTLRFTKAYKYMLRHGSRPARQRSQLIGAKVRRRLREGGRIRSFRALPAPERLEREDAGGTGEGAPWCHSFRSDGMREREREQSPRAAAEGRGRQGRRVPEGVVLGGACKLNFSNGLCRLCERVRGV